MIDPKRGISRQEFLRVALGATAGFLLAPDVLAHASPGSGDSSVPEPAGVGLPQHVIDLPADVRLRGANIAPRTFIDDRLFRAVGPNIWAAMWRSWEWDDWIAPQISDCASVGNAVRLWGDTEVVTSGLLTRGQYLKQWQQMLDFAAAKGLYVFTCGGGRGDFSHVEAVKLYRPWAELLASYPNVLGVDVLNESWSNSVSHGYEYADNVELVRSLTDTVRSCGLPATASFPMAKSEWWDWDGPQPIYRQNPIAPYWEASDYIDVHIYAPSTPAQLMNTFKFPWAKGKPVMFGEFGISTTGTNAQERTAFYRMVDRVMSSSPHQLGALAWSTYDVNNAQNAYGLFEAPGVPRAQMTSLLESFPVTRKIPSGPTASAPPIPPEVPQ